METVRIKKWTSEKRHGKPHPPRSGNRCGDSVGRSHSLLPPTPRTLYHQEGHHSCTQQHGWTMEANLASPLPCPIRARLRASCGFQTHGRLPCLRDVAFIGFLRAKNQRHHPKGSQSIEHHQNHTARWLRTVFTAHPTSSAILRRLMPCFLNNSISTYTSSVITANLKIRPFS